MKRLASIIAVLLLCACSATTLSASGSKLVAVGGPPAAECQSLGNVMGHGGGVWTGGMTTNENLAKSALNDAFNKAAELGATHIQASPPQFASNSGTTNSATVTAVAYKCPEAPAARPAEATAK